MQAKYLKFLIASIAFTTFASAQEEISDSTASSTQQFVSADTTQVSGVAVSTQQANEADSTMLSGVVDSTQQANVADSTMLSGVVDSTQQSNVAEEARQQASLDSLQPTVSDSVKLATVVTAPIQEEDAPIVYTEIAGKLNGFLTKEKSPYIATADLLVSEEDALVIDAGVEISFKPGTGLNIQGGAFAAVGQEQAPILLKAESDTWKGISITGETRATLNNVRIANAETAIALENTGADIRNLNVQNSTIGLSSKKSGVNLQYATFANCSGIGIFAGAKSTLALGNVEISNSKAGVLFEKNSRNTLTNISITKSDFGVIDLGYNALSLSNLKIQENDIGFATTETPTQAMIDAAISNRINTTGNAEDIAKALPSPPENSLAHKYKESEEEIASNIFEEPPKKWNLSGNVSTEIGYHFVRTLHNGTDTDFILENDTIHTGERYENYFRVPGLFSNYNTYLKLESPFGQTMEFNTEIGSDHWNEWNVHKINLTYTDASRKISLGDTYMEGGTTYLNGINVFGASYTVDYLKKAGERPTFETTVFAGETNRPKLVGDKNPEIYKDYIKDGEGEAQEVVAGGMITWNMHRRFNGTLGFMASEDYKEDPFFRDGMGENRNTINPEISSRTFFADGNWLFWPGNIELNGQIAVGAADTTDARTQRAINRIFSQAGVSASNFSLLRKIINDDKVIATLGRKTLEEIFGDNTSMTLSEMRSQLKALIKQAKLVEAQYDKKDDDQSKISEWDGNNFAIMTSLRWGIGNTTLNAYYKFVGSKFYSAGSPDQLSNSREMGASIDQRIMKFWRLSLGYDLNVENASIEDKANIFGFSEGTTAGLFGEPSSKWLKDHDQDELRALYIHNAALKNKFTIGNLELSLDYKLNYRTRHRATRLYAEFDPETGVFDDEWFKPNSNSNIYTMEGDYGEVSVDSARFLEYYHLASEYENFASDFEEKFLKHTVETEIGLKFYKNILKVGASWSFRTDLSEFGNDSLLSHFDFSDKTYGYLGYHFHSTDYFEQRYPISLTTETERIRNQFMFVPRYKIYDRDNMKEFEWSLSDQFEMEVVKNFVDVMLSGEIRQEFVRRHSDGTNESEADVNTSTTVRIHHTKDLYSDYTFGTIYNYRPDSRSEQYSDYFGVISLNYAF